MEPQAKKVMIFEAVQQKKHLLVKRKRYLQSLTTLFNVYPSPTTPSLEFQWNFNDQTSNCYLVDFPQHILSHHSELPCPVSAPVSCHLKEL